MKTGIQKIHIEDSLRLGGFAILTSIVIGSLIFNEYNSLNWLVILSIFPAFFVGFIEDITQSYPIRNRIIGLFVTSGLLIFLTNSYLSSIEIYYFDKFFDYTPVAIGFTFVGFIAMPNAWNFLDGLNGLASGMGIIALSMMSWIAFQNNHLYLLNLYLLFIYAILGFWLINITRGKVFLGDSGSYLLGILVGWSGVKLTTMGTNISEWTIFVIIIYPAFELIFSVFRRLYMFKSPFYPDNLHLHSLLYLILKSKFNNNYNLNSISSLILLMFGALPGFIALSYSFVFPNTLYIAIIFIIFYLSLYLFLFKYRT